MISKKPNRRRTLSEGILRLEFFAEDAGNVESLSLIYVEMYKRGLMNADELKTMIVSTEPLETENGIKKELIANGAILAFGHVIGKQYTDEDINYFKWSLSSFQTRNSAVKSLFKVITNSVVLGNLPDWRLIESMLHAYSGEKETYLAVQKGIKETCYAAKNGKLTIPEKFIHLIEGQDDLGELKMSKKKYLQKDFFSRMREMFSVESSKKIEHLEEFLEHGSSEEQKESFIILSQTYANEIKKGYLSQKEWQEAVYRRSVLPYASLYQESEQTLKNLCTDIPPRIAAANAHIAGRFHHADQKMTDLFRKHVYSSKGLQDYSLRKSFCDYKSDADSENTIAMEEEFLKTQKSANVVIVGEYPVVFDDCYSMLVHSVLSRSENNVLLTRPNVFYDIDNKKKVSVYGGFTIKNNRFYRIYANGKKGRFPDYVYDISLRKMAPHKPDFEGNDIPHYAESEIIDQKDLSLSLLQKNEVGVPNCISFWTEKEFLSPEARAIRKSMPKSYQMDGMPREKIEDIVKEFLNCSNKKGKVPGIVVKASDGRAGNEVRMIQAGDDAALAAHATEEICSFRNYEKSVVVQERVRTPPFRTVQGESQEASFRIWVCPDENGSPRACGSFVRIGGTQRPVNMAQEGAWALPTDIFLKSLEDQYPHLKPEISTLEERMEKSAEDAYSVLRKESEERIKIRRGEDSFSLLGADVMIELQGDKLIPKIIETNGAAGVGWSYLFKYFQQFGTRADPSYQKYAGGFLAANAFADVINRRASHYRKEQLGRSASPTRQTSIVTQRRQPFQGKQYGGPLFRGASGR